jgi:hypothetical protein
VRPVGIKIRLTGAVAQLTAETPSYTCNICPLPEGEFLIAEQVRPDRTKCVVA